MSQTLLIGPAGCGKTHALLDAFAGALSNAADPLAADLFFVVPSAEHTERVVSLLIQRGLKGFFHKRVTTLSRLASEMFRVTDVPVASSLTRIAILKDLVRENAWDYFEAVHDQPGFPGLLEQWITELKESCVTPEIFRERMNTLKGFEPAYGAKYEALAALYEQYEARLKAQGLRDSQDALRIFRERKKKADASGFRFKALWIDGFFDFSNLQLEYLRELSAAAEHVTVTLTQEEGRQGGDGFEAVGRTQSDLEKLGFLTERMKAQSRRTAKPSLVFLQQNIFGPSPVRPAPKPGGDILFLDAVGTEGEMELIAREIHRLYATGGYRFGDFAVLFRQIRHYAPVIASVFARYGIPAEVHERDRLKFSPWVAAAASLLAVFRNGWEREDVLRFLKSGYTRRWGAGESREEAWLASLEQRSFLEGVVRGREAWLADWKRGDAEDLAEFNLKKGKLMKTLAETEDAFRAARMAGAQIRIFKRAVYDTFGLLEVSDRYTVFTRRDAASVKRFEALLGEVEEHFLKGKNGEEVSFEAFADHFTGLVELDVYSLHERDKNRVQVYDVSLARQKEYKVVFVAGLLEKVFPMQVREDPLLSDWERKLMNGGLEHPLAERLPRQDIERFFFYTAVTRAQERLYLSHPHLDFEGKESLPSFYLEEVKELFKEPIPVICQSLARPFPSVQEAITSRETETATMGAFRAPELAGAGLDEALGKLSGDPGAAERFRSALLPVEAKISDEKILRGKYFDAHEMSPTRLETYAKCPFRYFAEKVLRLKDTDDDLRVMQKGSVLHYVLQKYFDPREKKDPRETVEAFVARTLEEGLRQSPILWTEPYREALDRRELSEMLIDFLNYEKERLQTASFQPGYVECSFGDLAESDRPAFEIEDGGKKIKLRGRVDRIDTDPERKFAVVIDYKRSARFKAADLELGTALQLPLYLLAAQKHLGLAPLGAEIYSVRDHKKSGFYCEGVTKFFEKEFSSRSCLADDVFQRTLDRAVVFVRKFSREIASAEIPVRPRDCESFCPYDTVCRIEKWRLPVFLEEIRKEDEKAGL